MIKELWSHPFIKGAVGVLVFVIVAGFLASFIPPAWAVSIPITDHISIELGDLPQWIIALVAAGGLYKAWRAEQKAADAAAKAAIGVAKIEAVAVQMDGLLKDRDKANVAEGVATGEKKGVEAAVQLAEGQRQGIEMARASAAAGAPASADAAIQAATAAAAAAAIAAPAAAAIAAPPAAAIAAPPAADIAAPPVVRAVVPPAVEEAVKAAFEKERLKEKK